MKPPNIDKTEDLWLACLCEAPTYLDHSKVRNLHLSERAKAIHRAISTIRDEGFSFVTPELLAMRGFDPATISGIRSKIGKIHAPSTIEIAEKRLIESWRRVELAKVYNEAAKISFEQGESRATSFVHQRMIELDLDQQAGGGWDRIHEHAKRYFAKLRAKVEGHGDVDIHTGYPALDLSCRYWKPRRMTALGARTSHGKSTFSNQLLIGMAMRGIPCGRIDVEDEPEIPTSRAAMSLVDEFRDILNLNRSGVTHEDITRAEMRMMPVLESLPYHIDYKPNGSAEDIAAAMEQGVRKLGLKVIVVDYLQAVKQRGRDRTSSIIETCGILKAAAGRTGCHLILCSQLAERNIEDRRPTKNDFKWAGEIENMAEYCVLLHRPEKVTKKDAENGQELRPYESVEIIVDKAKDGTPGILTAFWDKSRNCFSAEIPF